MVPHPVIDIKMSMIQEIAVGSFFLVCVQIQPYIRRCVMVSLPLHGEIYAFNGDNIVAINNIFVIIDIHIGVAYTCTVVIY
jgi:hypothetical protein